MDFMSYFEDIYEFCHLSSYLEDSFGRTLSQLTTHASFPEDLELRLWPKVALLPETFYNFHQFL
jgi:hypothetical protein